MIFPPANLDRLIIIPANGASVLELFDHVSAATSPVWDSGQNNAIYIPFFLPRTQTFSTFGIYNGATINGNIDIGVYNGLNLTKITSTGSTAHAGASQLQTISVTAFVLSPGFYLLAAASDSATATFLQGSTTSNHYLGLAGIRHEASAFALPSTATPVYPPSSLNTIPYVAML